MPINAETMGIENLNLTMPPLAVLHRHPTDEVEDQIPSVIEGSFSRSLWTIASWRLPF
jgi:hypothetical protein